MTEPRQMPIADLLQDGVLVINDGYRAKNSELATHGLPFARAQNINGGFNFEGADCFPEEDLAKVGNKISQPGDVVFTSKGTVGRFAFVRDDTPRFVYAPQLCFWRVLDSKRLNARWLFYWMQSREFYVQFKGVAAQTDMAEYVSLSDQRRMHITVPGIAEQRAIAAVLGALDDKIELNRRMCQTLEGIARALFESWFVRFDPVRRNMARKGHGQPSPGLRPPSPSGRGFGGEGSVEKLPSPRGRRAGDEGVVESAAFDHLFPDRLVDSPLGPIPEGWAVLRLDEVANFLNGLALQKFPPHGGRSLPVIKIAQLRAGHTVGADEASADIDPAYVVTDGDVLFSWSGSLECVLWAGGRGALNQHLFRVTSHRFPKWFFYHWIHQHLEHFRHIAAGKATTMGHIQRHHLSEGKVVVPPADILRAGDRLLAPAIDAIVSKLIESHILPALRDALLPKLVSGELRIRDVERIIGRCA